MISLTETAAEKVKLNLSKRAKGAGIRVGVKTTGCSGLAYVLEYVDLPNGIRNDDVSFVSHGVHVFVDPKSLVYLEGIEMLLTDRCRSLSPLPMLLLLNGKYPRDSAPIVWAHPHRTQ